jgi:hypothetical protein
MAARLNVGITTLMSGDSVCWLRTNPGFRMSDAPTSARLDRAWTLAEYLLVFFKRVAWRKSSFSLDEAFLFL